MVVTNIPAFADVFSRYLKKHRSRNDVASKTQIGRKVSEKKGLVCFD